MDLDETSHTAVGEYSSLIYSGASRLLRYHAAPLQKHVCHVTTHCVCTVYKKLLSVLLMSSLLGDSVLVTTLFRLSVYFVRCLPLILVPQIFLINICFSIPSAPFICVQKIVNFCLLRINSFPIYPCTCMWGTS